MIRITLSDTDFCVFLRDTAVLHFETFFFIVDTLFLATLYMRHKTTAQWNTGLLLVTNERNKSPISLLYRVIDGGLVNVLF